MIFKQRLGERDVDGFIKYHIGPNSSRKVIEVILKLHCEQIGYLPEYPKEKIDLRLLTQKI